MSYLSEAVRLVHWRMLVAVGAILSIAHFLSPYPLDVTRYVAGLVGVLVALCGIYRYNEVADFVRGKTPRIHHLIIGTILIVLGASVGVLLSLIYAWWIIVYLALGVGGMLAYNLLRTPIVHNRVTYGVVWGGLPFVASFCLQTLDPTPPPYIIVWAVFFSFVAVEILWTWGPAGCRYQLECKRARPDKVCHSPVMTCGDRANMPKAVRRHTKAMVTMKMAGMVLLAVAVFMMR